jgi:hypothetical protein
MLYRHRRLGLTLLELVTVMGLVTVFLALAYQPLEQLLLYPRRSLIAFSDRAAASNAERRLVEDLTSTQAGYLWAEGDSILMGQAREFRKPKESPITQYALIHYDPDRSTLERWALPPDLVNRTLGEAPAPSTDFPRAGWQGLLALRQGKSLLATHVTRFAFEKGSPGQPCAFEISVSTPNSALPENRRSGPSKTVRRSVALVGDP